MGDSLREEFSNDLNGLYDRIAEMEGSCQGSLQTNRQIIDQQVKSLKEVTAQQSLSIEEMANKVDHEVAQISAKYDGLKDELSRDCKSACSELERAISPSFGISNGNLTTDKRSR